MIDANMELQVEVVRTRPHTFQPHSMPLTTKLIMMAPPSSGILLRKTQLLIHPLTPVLFLSTLSLPKAMIVLDYTVCLPFFLAISFLG